MNATTDLPRIPLEALRLSPLNARKTTTHGVEDLAASIEAHGLLQNLTVTPAANGDGFEVVAGGRRLAAMQLLQREQRLPASLEQIPCLVITDADVAHEASTAENTLREAMHPADQFEAFKAMVDAGKPIADVAAHFGVAERVVTQRLKLANVAPDLFDLYRNGTMDLDQLQALALTDDHAAQRNAWNVPNEWERRAHSIRQRITHREISANGTLARFVGLEAYEAAGGGVRRDLFSEQAWLQDKALADKLALDKLEALAQAERDAGWSWAEARITADYSDVSAFRRVKAEPTRGKLTPAMKERLAAVEARRKEIEAQLYDENGDQREELDQDLADDLQAEDDELAGEEASLKGGREVWPTEAMKAAGVLVFLDEYNGLNTVRGLIRPNDKAAAELPGVRGATTAATKPEKPKPKKPELSAAILNVLSAHRSAVAGFHVSRDPQLALALLIDWYYSALKHDWGHANVLHLSATTVPDAHAVAPDIHKALATEEGLPLALYKKVPRTNRLAWLIQQPQQDLLAMLAYLVGNRFAGLSDNPAGHRGIAELHAAIGFDMANHWNPACDNFLGRIPAALVVQAVTEAKGKDAAAGLSGLKKDALIAEAAKQLAGTGWLPGPLRGPGYAVGAKRAKAAAKAKPAATKSAKKKPAKKASKKASRSKAKA